jgi:hypothetical protein
MKANVELRISELILRGLPYAHRGRIAAAVESELLRLLDEHGLPPSLEAGCIVPEIRIDGMRLAADAKPESIGEQIAGSVYGSLSGGRSGSSGGRAA